MATTQTVIIDFQADFSSVQDAVTILEKTGKVDAQLADTFRKTNTEINKQGQALDKTAKQGQQTTQNFTKLSQLMQQFPKSGMNRFLLQVGNELAAAGVKATDFFKKVDPKEAPQKIISLRQELKLLKDQMQQAALSGGVLGEEYLRLKKRAGELDDTIKDVASDIANAGSDTRGIDNVVGSISALAGGYSAVQGAAALFGEESEDLQKALLKVNAAMALATGLQQVNNALTKQGSLFRLADAAATQVQVAVQKVYTLVTGRATAATLAFKVALAATGIGLVVVGILALSQALKSSTSDMERATEAIEAQNAALETQNGVLQRRLSIQLAESERAGKLESDRLRITGRNLQAQVKNLEASNQKLAEQRDQVNATSKAWFTLNDEIEKNNETIRDLNTQVIVTSINLEKQLADEQISAIRDKEKLQSAAATNERQRFNIRINTERQILSVLIKSGADAAAISKQQTEIAAIEAARRVEIAKRQKKAELEIEESKTELSLILTNKGTIEEYELKKKLLNQQMKSELENEDLTTNERALILQNYFNRKAQLEKEFNKASLQRALDDEKDRLGAILENLNLSEEEKLNIKISFLQISAAKEIEDADKNAAKIKAINAKLNADIASARIESIRKVANEEIALELATGGKRKRALERVADDERRAGDLRINQLHFSAAVRINAVRQLSDIETESIDRQIKANRDASKVIGADQKALTIEYEQLLDQKAAAAEAAEKKITDITLAETKIRRDNDIAYIQATIGGLQSLSDILSSIQSGQQESSQQAIEARKKEVDDLLEAGAITEKEADKRNKRIAQEERQAKQKAAQQQKQIAVFQAFLAIPQAYIAGLTAPFPVGGPIYGAVLAGLAAVQASIIASRPVPKFASGKKGSYRGVAEVGEIGAELIQRADGSMEVATRRQLVYLGSQDKVFTAGETKKMLPGVNYEAMKVKDGAEKFDYNKLAKAVKGNSTGTSINIDKEFISESVASGLSRVNYFDRYYNSKG